LGSTLALLLVASGFGEESPLALVASGFVSSTVSTSGLVSSTVSTSGFESPSTVSTSGGGACGMWLMRYYS
jgi:hypothetical protein